METSELFVMDLKRCRVGQEDGPDDLITQKEDAMLISNDEDTSPKNDLQAGPPYPMSSLSWNL